MSNPVEEFLLTKQALGLNLGGMRSALTSPTAKRIGGAAVAAVGAGIGAAGFAGAVGATEKMYLAATKTRDFRQMLEANPDLRAHQQADPAGFNRMFTSLRTFAPDFTREPMVAGAYMRNAMETPEESRGMVGVRAMGDLKQPRKGPGADAAQSAFGQVLGSGLKPSEGKKNLVHQEKHQFDPQTEGWKNTEMTDNTYG
jgi:hypothetical protein